MAINDLAQFHQRAITPSYQRAQLVFFGQASRAAEGILKLKGYEYSTIYPPGFEPGYAAVFWQGKSIDSMKDVTTADIKRLQVRCEEINQARKTMDDRYNAPPPRPVVPAYQDAMDGLTGVPSVMAALESLKAVKTVSDERVRQGHPGLKIKLHMAMTGNPGTGKTTSARLIGKFLKHNQMLTVGECIEINRAMVMGEYIGMTEKKTLALLEKSLGSVALFDEFHTFGNAGHENDYGRRVIDTLVPFMENHDNFCVILAGYPEPMQRAIATDPGLKSRITRFIHLPDYTGDQLIEIFDGMMRAKKYVMTSDAYPIAAQYIRNHAAVTGKDFGNARDMRNLVDKIQEVQALRISASMRDLLTVTAEDISDAAVRAGLSGA